MATDEEEEQQESKCDKLEKHTEFSDRYGYIWKISSLDDLSIDELMELEEVANSYCERHTVLAGIHFFVMWKRIQDIARRLDKLEQR